MIDKDGKYLKNRKIIFVVCGCLFVLAVLVISVFAAVELPKSGTLELGVAPQDATITIGNGTYKNGTHKMIPGTYSISLKRDGFKDVTGTIIIEDGKVTTLKYCMATKEGNEDYRMTKDDQDLCFAASEYEESMARKEEQADEIYQYLPYRSYKDGYSISAEKADGENIIVVTITTMSCREVRNKQLQQDALEYLKSKNLNLDKYFITYKSSCDGSE